MKTQNDFFNLIDPEPEPELPDTMTNRAEKVVYIPYPMRCDYADSEFSEVVPCHGDIYEHGISRYRCARHITMQYAWQSGQPERTHRLDLIDWIKAGHFQVFIDKDIEAIDRMWKRVSADRKYYKGEKYDG